VDFHLNAEQEQLRATVRDFARHVVAPRAAETDREHRFPHEILSAAAEVGLMGILIPPEYGGSGLDHLSFALVIEEIAAACATTAVILDVHNSVAVEPIIGFASEPVRRRWLTAMAAGDCLAAFALSEPGSGSDASALRTAARRADGGWVLDGTKTFITNGGQAGLYVVFARTGAPEVKNSRAISCFAVPADAPGLEAGQPFEKMGLNGSSTTELRFEGVRVPDDALIGAQGQGWEIAMRVLDAGRIGISAQALGIARGALDEATAHLREREQFGRRLAEFQGLQFMLAEMETEWEAARWLTYHAVSECDAGRPFSRLASMAKLFSTDMAMRVATDCLQLHGGYGYSEEFPLARHFRDAKAAQIYEGTNQVQRMVIARHLLA
jgi:alkylation response protein AidB-like acyl-CoA dehydrogenase